MAFTHLHVMTSITNVKGYRSRYTLYRQFAAYLAQFPNVTLWTIEGLYPGQEPQVTKAGHPHHVQVALTQPLWMMENLLNVLSRHLPDDGQPLAWIDADVELERVDWVNASLAMLEHCDLMQPYSTYMEYDSAGRLMPYSASPSFAFHESTRDRSKAAVRYMSNTGGAWCATREGFQRLGHRGGLADFCVVGQGDLILGAALMNVPELALPDGISLGYRETVKAFVNATQQARLKLDYLPGKLYHHWHGARSNRGYTRRTELLVRTQYDPTRDLHYRPDGVMELAESRSMERLQSHLHNYFTTRKEDEK